MKTKLGKICSIDWGNTSLTKKSYLVDGKYLAVSAKGCDGRINHYEHEEDVCVLSAIGAQCGKMFFPQEKFTAIKNTITLKPKKELVSSKFLYYLLTSIDLPKRGAAQPFMSKRDIEKFEINNLPKLKEQQQIIAKLDSVFAEIGKSNSLNKKKLEAATTVISNVLPDLFDRYVSKFIDSPLGSLFKVSSGKFLPKKKMNSEGNIKVYGGNGISGSHDDFNLDGKNILIGRVGAYCGNVHYVNEKIWLTDNAMYTHSYKYNFNLKFLSLILSSINMGSFARHAAQPVISFSSIKDLKIRFPESVDEQSQIVNAFEKIENNLRKLRINYKKQKQNFEVLKSSILSQEIKNKVA